MEDRNVILNKVKTWLLLTFVIWACFCIIESYTVKAQIISAQTQLLNNSIDPSDPSSRYVLDKLNKHLSNSITDESSTQDKYQELSNKLKEMQAQDLNTKLAVVVEKQETDSWLLKAVFGGIATILGKEIVEMVKVRQSK